MKNNFDYLKEQYRGTLKQIMKVRGLRTISIANYINWLNRNGGNRSLPLVHSVKLDIQDGYINAYGWKDKKCGDKIDDVSAEAYRNVLDVASSILHDEENIPYKVKRNILVKMSR